MRRLHPAWARNRRPAQALVETAITIGILLMVILNGISFTQWLGAQAGVAAATRLAAQTAAMYGEYVGRDSEIVRTRLSEAHDAVGQYAMSSATAAAIALRGNPFTDPSYALLSRQCIRNLNTMWTLPYRSSECRRFDYVEVTITYDAPAWLPTPFVQRITAQSTIRMVYEQDPLVTPAE